MLASYQRLKSQRSLLDYDDLIARTRSLLSRVEAAWVLYKLDAGIDHILLDEAQDTSEAQWAILGKLAEEFSAADGARAEPAAAHGLRRRRREAVDLRLPGRGAERLRRAAAAAQASAIAAAGQRFESVSLNTSFRSTPDIMQAVDAVFAVQEHARGLVFDGALRPEPHDTVRRNDPGCVDLWPICRR